MRLVPMKTWQDHFTDVCREHGLDTEIEKNGVISIINKSGSPIDVVSISKEATKRAYGIDRLLAPPQEDPPSPISREEWDRKVDEMEDRKDADRMRAKRRAALVSLLKEASLDCSSRGDFLSAANFELVLAAIEKDLI